jgi:hypothetical protein
MKNSRIIERRREPRTEVNLPLRVWGVNTRGERFVQEARARDVSLSGALLSGLETELRTGDVIGIFYAGRQARYRVVWVGQSRECKMQAAVHRVETDECPWQDLLREEPGVVSVAGTGQAACSNSAD